MTADELKKALQRLHRLKPIKQFRHFFSCKAVEVLWTLQFYASITTTYYLKITGLLRCLCDEGLLIRDVYISKQSYFLNYTAASYLIYTFFFLHLIDNGNSGHILLPPTQRHKRSESKFAAFNLNLIG